MPTKLADLMQSESVDIADRVLSQFEGHSDEALSLDEISNGVLGFEDSEEDFSIEGVRSWRPFNRYLISGSIRHVYYIFSVVGMALNLLVESGKVHTITIKNPSPHAMEWSPKYLTYYYV